MSDRNENLIYVSPEDDLHALLSCFKVHKISHVPVVREQKVVGMIAKTDVVESLHEKMRSHGESSLHEVGQQLLAKEIMIQPIVTADINASEAMLLEKLIDHQVSSVILTREGQIAGIVTLKDMLAYMAEHGPQRELSVTETFGLHLVEWMDKKGLLRISRALADIGI